VTSALAAQARLGALAGVVTVGSAAPETAWPAAVGVRLGALAGVVTVGSAALA
jgi:hypothetical protein